MQRSRIAVIGGGIAGLSAAWILQTRHQVQLFEAEPELGGHAHTVEVPDPQGHTAIDTGFVVYNERNYPLLTRLFTELDVPTQDTDMSFGYSRQPAGVEYAGSDLNTLFAQRRNLVRPTFLRMARDILRFNRLGKGLFERGESPEGTLGAFLARHRLGRGFTEDYLLPMAAAIWSCPPEEIREFPAASFLQFFHNHGLLDLRDRPQWRTVVGGSREYVQRLAGRLEPGSVVHQPVRAVIPEADRWRVLTHDQAAGFDAVVFACHANTARWLLNKADPARERLLAACRFQPNRAVLHTDPALMPRSRRVWSSWNYLSGRSTQARDSVSVSYWMNRLHRLERRQDYIISLNPWREPHPNTVLGEQHWEHPVMDTAAEKARQRLAATQGENNLYFAGAWMGYGFHEDGLRSAVSIGRSLGIEPPWSCPAHPPMQSARQPGSAIHGGVAAPAHAPPAQSRSA
ncbi:NAD(P)/FAD-dependent oxidoreductase [Thioalkalivibrio versutus]|uniref:NAD(P)/FAD-dependent oxidoreductase n=1 Tax=Thioalkalivibrio versutus TaxID=106634 RepID=UPI000984BD32|nr:FAD-dependent oxidoreductase [Thioalkalivibrio versutus]OOC50178.1 NAD/FAD-binding protein [Thioalkalivibrio versutus]